MRKAAILATTMAVLANGCSEAPPPPKATWSCTSRDATCNAPVQGVGIAGEKICYWSCAEWEGEEGSLFVSLFPGCGEATTETPCPPVCLIRSGPLRGPCGVMPATTR
jgi:hypothetical protein